MTSLIESTQRHFAARISSDAAFTDAESERHGRSRHGRSRRRRRHRRSSTREHRPSPHEPGGREKAGQSDLRAWFDVVNSLLNAVEETAWSARDLADSATRAWNQGEREVRGARGVASSLGDQVTRLTQTGFMLARVATGYRLHGLRSAFVSRGRAAEMLDELHEKSARRFYEVSAANGGAFMKVGQLLSARPDLLPAVWVRELSKLQDAAPPIPFETVKEALEGDFGTSLSELFASFDEAPLAAASIGQVHRATTKDGLAVAVKIQRPGIAARVKMDLELLEAFVSSLRDSLPETDYETIVEQIRTNVLSELDYVGEAKTTARVSAFFADHPSISVPKPIEALCSKHVLTTTFAPGTKISTALDALGARRTEGDPNAHGELSSALGNLLEAYLRQVLEAGVFQADPHPGNLLVTEDGKIVVLDFGCAETLEPQVRDRYLSLVRAIVAGDRDRAAELFGQIGFATRSGRPDTLHAFADALLGEIRQMALAGPVIWPSREEAVARATRLLSACDHDPVVTLPGEFIMIARVFGTLAGLFSNHRPDIDFVRHVLPVLGPVLF